MKKQQNGASNVMMKRPAQICQIPATMHKGVIVMQHQKPKKTAAEMKDGRERVKFGLEPVDVKNFGVIMKRSILPPPLMMPAPFPAHFKYQGSPPSSSPPPPGVRFEKKFCIAVKQLRKLWNKTGNVEQYVLLLTNYVSRKITGLPDVVQNVKKWQLRFGGTNEK